jgi:hypothetical protein
VDTSVLMGRESLMFSNENDIELVTIPDAHASSCTDKDSRHNLLFSHTFIHPEFSVSEKPPMNWCPSPYCHEVKTSRRMTLYYIVVKHDRQRDFSFTGYAGQNSVFGEVFSYSIWVKFNPHTIQKGWYQLEFDNFVSVSGTELPLRSVVSSSFYVSGGSDGSQLKPRSNRISTLPMLTVLDKQFVEDILIPKMPSRSSSDNDLFMTSDNPDDDVEDENFPMPQPSKEPDLDQINDASIRRVRSLDEIIIESGKENSDERKSQLRKSADAADIATLLSNNDQISSSESETYHNALEILENAETVNEKQ